VKKKTTRFGWPKGEFAAYIDKGVHPVAIDLNPHCHDGYELLYFIEGESHIRIHSKTYRAGAGDLAIYRPQVIHKEQVQPGRFHCICLRFPREKVNLPFPATQVLEPVIHLPWQERFRNILEQIVLEKQGIDRWSERMTGIYLMQFVVLLWRALSEYKQTIIDAPEEHRSRISRIIDLIYAQIDSDVPLKELADKAFMSESHFSHTFKDVMGVSPKRYMISARIGKAQDLLARTDRSVIDISRELGYQSPHYFNRIFKKECGCTPLQHRYKSRKVQSR
jgi:AraC-like DNA-binding protein